MVVSAVLWYQPTSSVVPVAQRPVIAAGIAPARPLPLLKLKLSFQAVLPEGLKRESP